MPDQTNPVPAAQPGASVPEPQVSGTPGAQSPVAPQATPAQPAVDVEQLKAQYEAQLQRAQRDIDRMKSSFQKSEALKVQEAERRAKELEAQLEKIQLAGMDDTERQNYERETAVARAQELERRAMELEAQNNEQKALFQAYSYFLQQGVPAQELDVDNGYDALFQSGWSYIMNERQQLLARIQNPSAGSASQNPAPAQPPQAPPVVTHTAPVSTGAPTWDDLIKRFGSREKVYEAIESGRIKGEDILPGLRK